MDARIVIPFLTSCLLYHATLSHNTQKYHSEFAHIYLDNEAKTRLAEKLWAANPSPAEQVKIIVGMNKSCDEVLRKIREAAAAACE